MLKSGGRLRLSVGNVTTGFGGTGPLGCLRHNRSQVSRVLGAIPDEVRTLIALPSSPSLALEIA